MIWQQVVGALCSFKKLLLGTHHVLEDTVVFETKSLSWSFRVECKVIETVWFCLVARAISKNWADQGRSVCGGDPREAVCLDTCSGQPFEDCGFLGKGRTFLVEK